MISGPDLNSFRGTRALITGGMGFIGSNLAIALVDLGAEVTIVDAMIPGYGGNMFNIAPIRDSVKLNFCDIRDRTAIEYVVRDQDFIFHLAGQVDHLLSLTDPFPDIEMNITGTALLLEACRSFGGSVRLVYTGTRGQYGPAVSLPVAEDAPSHPRGIYEISNLTAEKIVQVYHEVHGIKSVMLRLSNIYGPRAQMRHSRYGVANWFVRLALEGATIPVFGDGMIKRDFLYVDDCVRAILMSALAEAASGQVLNVGVDQPHNFKQLAEFAIQAAGSGSWELTEFSPERKAQEPGDFFSDITKIRGLVGWEPEVDLGEGLRRTVEYYRRHARLYWD